MLRLLLLSSLLSLLAVLAISCSDDGDSPAGTSTPAPIPTVTVPPATPTPAPSPTPTVQASGAPDAPTDVEISGALPDLRTPVPPGQGELGRITVEWRDNSDDETGFRIYQSCDGAESMLAEVGPDTESLGPLQACRPGRVGVAAYNAAGSSAIAWSN